MSSLLATQHLSPSPRLGDPLPQRRRKCQYSLLASHAAKVRFMPQSANRTHLPRLLQKPGDGEAGTVQIPFLGDWWLPGAASLGF